MTENLPVSWEDQMKADAKSQLINERPPLSLMSLKSGQMSIGGEAVPGNELLAIIVANATENAWFPNRYDPNKRENPACYAIGEGKAVDLVPYEESTDKQAERCAICPKFEWGSDPNGGRGKACKEKRRLAMLRPDGGDELLLVSIPPTSLKNWSNHVGKVVATTGMSTAGVVTKIKVVPSAKNQFEVQFEIAGPVPQEFLPAMVAKKADAMNIMLQPYPELEDDFETPKKDRKY